MTSGISANISSTAFQLRLDLLESLLSGSSSSSTLSTNEAVTKDFSTTKDIQTRTTSLEDDFQRLISGGSTAASGADNIRRFVDRFESIQTLLKSLPPAPSSTTTEDLSSTSTTSAEPVPTTSKLPHILSLHPDLLESTHLLTQLGILADQDVSGSGTLVQGYALDQADDTRARLAKVQSALAERSRAGSGVEGEAEGKTGDKVQVTQADNLRRMVGLLTRWDDFTKQSSQIFLNLHETMTDLERAVERVERIRMKV